MRFALSSRASRVSVRKQSRSFGRLECLEERRLLTLVPELVADLNTTGAGSQISTILSAGDRAFFLTEKGIGVTDGTSAGTQVFSGPSNSQLVVSDELAFVTDGRRLWRSDGTADGTLPLSFPNYGWDNGLRSLVATRSRAFFTQELDSGVELWTSDGTDAGTQLVKDILPGSASSKPRQLVPAGDKVFFIADDAGGAKLWMSDGSEAGTVALSAAAAPGFSWATAINDKIIFAANDLEIGTELWISDGTVLGTKVVKEILPGPVSSSPANLTRVGNRVFFTADDGIHGRELWVSDGTDVGTVMVRDLNANGSTFKAGVNLAASSSGNLLYFVLASNAADRQQLWRSDGTNEGTLLVAEMHLWDPDRSPLSMLMAGNDGNLFFSAWNQEARRQELWTTDGTSEGTVRVEGLGQSWEVWRYSPPTAMLNGRLLFTAITQETGRELWTSDGTAAGTLLVKDLNTATNPSSPYLFHSFRGEAYFLVNQGGTMGGLWKSDGTATGTVQIMYGITEVRGRDFWESTSPLKVGTEAIYFVRRGNLWRTDGTEQGTYVLQNGLSREGLALLGRRLFFSKDSGIWVLDTVTEEAEFVAPLFANFAESAVKGDKLYFYGGGARGSTKGLMVTDGTAAGTKLLSTDSRPGFQPLELRGFRTVGNKVLFTAHDPIHGRELWASDGTELGTHLVKDLEPDNLGSYGSEIERMRVVGDQLFFYAYDRAHGRELWRSDGTEAGTIRVTRAPGMEKDGQNTGDLASYRGKLYFIGPNDELWESNGTIEGTVKAPVQVSKLVRISVINDRLWLGAYYGSSLFVSDGTNEGTFKLIDEGFYEAEFRARATAVGNVVFFQGILPGYPGEPTKLTAPLGDTNFDLRVDLEDLNNVRDHLGGYGFGDADHDGDVDLDDLNAVRNLLATGVSNAILAATRHDNYAARDAVFAMAADTSQSARKSLGKHLVNRTLTAGV